MNWNDEAIILSIAKSGESSLFITMVTKEHGIAKGYTNYNKRNHYMFEVGTLLIVNFRQKEESKYGSFTAELKNSFALKLLENPEKLSLIQLMCLTATHVFSQSYPDPDSFNFILNTFYKILATDNEMLGSVLVRFELSVLETTGFGLNLTKCAVTNTTSDLEYISPKTGSVISKEVGEPYKDKLFKLPKWLLTDQINNFQEVLDALEITFYFLNKYYYIVKNDQIMLHREIFLKFLTEANLTIS